ncbi:hypothetical protein PG593_10960, partial [Riemerella anatipestifer]|nr:hypothetical protein [Riemerella anatipestifer]
YLQSNLKTNISIMTNVINLSEKFQICEKKKMNSDSILLSDLLGVSQAAAWSRYKRGKPIAVEVMYRIVTGREEMIDRIRKELKELETENENK